MNYHRPGPHSDLHLGTLIGQFHRLEPRHRRPEEERHPDIGENRSPRPGPLGPSPTSPISTHTRRRFGWRDGWCIPGAVLHVNASARTAPRLTSGQVMRSMFINSGQNVRADIHEQYPPHPLGDVAQPTRRNAPPRGLCRFGFVDPWLRSGGAAVIRAQPGCAGWTVNEGSRRAAARYRAGPIDLDACPIRLGRGCERHRPPRGDAGRESGDMTVST